MIELNVQVTTVINRYAVAQLGGKLVTWEGTQRMSLKNLPGHKDRYAGLNAEGPAEVRIGLEEKLSGPSGTYSSVNVKIEVAVRCDQNKEAIDGAKKLLVDEGMKALEHYMGAALEMLIEHTKRQD